jgi:hypothetical protein
VNELTIIGKTDWRNTNQIFGIKDKDRLSHIYCLGKTGTGKSTLLMNMAISDIERGNGICIIDPHGDIAENILDYIPRARINDVIYFNAADLENSIAFNPLDSIHISNHHLIASGLISTFKKIWSDSWGPRLEHILRFSILTLLHCPETTLLDIQPLLTNPFFKSKALNYVTDTSILNFWQNEFDKYTPQFRNEAISPILNKIGAFIASEPLRYIIGQKKTTFQMQDIIDNKKILICNLSKGVIGEETSCLMGAMILTAIQSAVLFRASYETMKRVPFYVYVDEMHSFLTLSFVDILAEARKYGLGLFLTHQYIQQLDEKIQSAIFGNVGTLITFRLGAEDAKQLEREFYPVFKESDFINLPRYSIYLKLMIDGATSKPFSAVAMPLPSITKSFADRIIKYSIDTYSIPRELIEECIAQSQAYTPSEKGVQRLF